MRPEIRQYLEEHGRDYTPEALRRGLLEAGYDPAEVDAALAEWQAELGSSSAAEPESAERFGLWAVGLHGAVFLGLIVLFLVNGIMGGPYAAFAVGILLVLLLVGWLISAAIGRSLLARSGLGVALIAPAVSALLIGGSCLAVTGGL